MHIPSLCSMHYVAHFPASHVGSHPNWCNMTYMHYDVMHYEIVNCSIQIGSWFIGIVYLRPIWVWTHLYTNKQKVTQPNVKIINSELLSCIPTGHHHNWHLPRTRMQDGGVVWMTCLHHNPPSHTNMNGRTGQLPSGFTKLCCTQKWHAILMPHHLHPSHFQNVRWRGIWKTVGIFERWMSNVEWLGHCCTACM